MLGAYNILECLLYVAKFAGMEFDAFDLDLHLDIW